MRTINDIKVIVYNIFEKENEIVSKYLQLNNKNFFEYNDELELRRIVDDLQNSGYKSKEVIIFKKFMGRMFQKCPGSSNVICCNYMLLNTCFDCLYDCTYCFLNSYLNSFGIIQFTNLERITQEIKEYAEDKNKVYRIGTGEFTDSLMMDDVTEISKNIIQETSNIKNIMLEFKTKSDKVDHLLNIKDKGNAVLAWSLNTDKNIELYESGTASLNKRIEAAVKASNAGYFLAFHFDPIIIYENCIIEYCNVIDKLFSSIDPEKIVWISLGCFRYSSGFKEIIRDKFPEERMTLEEMFPGVDGKFRYLKHKRIDIYKKITEKINSKPGNPFIYLCMESNSVWESVFNISYLSSDELEAAMSNHLKIILN